MVVVPRDFKNLLDLCGRYGVPEAATALEALALENAELKRELINARTEPGWAYTIKGAEERAEAAEACVKDAVDAERERCAQICEAESGPGFSCRHVDHAQGFCECSAKAAAIRARSW